MRFASLGSGSEGNALVVQHGGTTVMMDCGFNLSESTARLAMLGLTPDALDAILVTHEHGDHIAGVARLARKAECAVWVTHGTRRAHVKGLADLEQVVELNPHESFEIGDLQITPYLVPHDAAEPVQFVFGDGLFRLGVLTDAGSPTPHIEQMLTGCDALVLECNHDISMLANGDYPYSLKQRVGGRYGHLNNDQAGQLLGVLDVSKLQHVIAAHISRKNNLPELAVQALSAALGCGADWIGVADQEQGFGWRELRQ